MPRKGQKNCIVPLNLPLSDLRLVALSGGMTGIYDPLRHKTVVLTPEEWVRQNFVAYMVNELGYPPSLMANEVGVNLNGLQRRCDTVVWNSGDGTPLMIVEYKAPSVKITSKVFDQIVRYNMVLRAPYLIVSNGLQHSCCRIDAVNNSYAFLRELPRYSALVNTKS